MSEHQNSIGQVDNPKDQDYVPEGDGLENGQEQVEGEEQDNQNMEEEQQPQNNEPIIQHQAQIVNTNQQHNAQTLHQQPIKMIEEIQPQKSEKSGKSQSDLINSYENRIFSLSQQISILKAANQELFDTQKLKQDQLSQQLESNIQKKYKIQQLEAQIQLFSKNQETIKQHKRHLQQKLKSYESQQSVEDVKKQLQISKHLQETLKSEIICLNQRIEILQKNQIAPDLRALTMFDEEKKRVQSATLQISILQTKLNEQSQNSQNILNNNIHLSNQIQTLRASLNLKQENIHKLTEIVNNTENNINDLKADNSKLENELSQLRANSQGPKSNYLTEKEQILKDYLALEQKFYKIKETLELNIKAKSQIENNYNKLRVSTVSKQQYQSLSRRYVEAKKRLEASNRNNQQLQNVFISEDQPIIELRSRLSQEQSKQLEIIKRIEQFGSTNHSQIEISKNRQELLKTKTQCQQYKYSSNTYKQQLQKTKLQLSEAMAKCINLSSKLSSQTDKWLKIQHRNQELNNDYNFLKLRANANQAKILEMANTIISLQKIGLSYKLSCESLKSELQNLSSVINTKGHSLSQFQSDQQPRLEFKIVEIKKQIPLLTQSTQTPPTQNVSKFKQLTQVLVQFPTKLDSILNELASTNKQGNDLNQKFNMKFKTLATQKQDNDRWRNKTKQDITESVRKEFNDIKDIIENERLFTALKKAKYLIDQYSKDEQQKQELAQQQVQQYVQQQVQQQAQQQAQVQNANPDIHNGNNNEQDPTLSLF